MSQHEVGEEGETGPGQPAQMISVVMMMMMMVMVVVMMVVMIVMVMIVMAMMMMVMIMTRHFRTGLSGVKRKGLATELLAHRSDSYHQSWSSLWDTVMPQELLAKE